MSIKESKMELVAGIVLAVLSLALYFFIIPAQIKDVGDAFPSPRTFPNAIVVVLFCLSVCLGVSGWRKRDEPDQKEYAIEKNEAKLVGITMLAMVIYVFLLPVITYIPATILLLAALIFAYGQRNWVKLGAVAVALPIVIYFAFTYLLKLRLP